MLKLASLERQTFSLWYHFGSLAAFSSPLEFHETYVGVRTCDTEGLFSRPLLVRLSRPFSDENRPFFRCR